MSCWHVISLCSSVIVLTIFYQSELGIPGTIGALVVERPTDVEEGFALTAPVLYHYGHKSPSENVPLYNLLISRLAEVVNTRCETNSRSKFR